MHALVICARRYNGHELWTALGVIKQRGHTFEVVSSYHIIQDEITMRPNKIKRTLDDPYVNMGNYDALMIVSGNMADTEAYWKDQRVLKLVDDCRAQDKPLAAICCSVPTIRHAAKDKTVSFFPLVRSRVLLQQAGAKLSTLSLSVDGKLATAENQMLSQHWAEEFCNIIDGKSPSIAHLLTDSGYTPRGRERKPIPELEDLKRKLNGTPKRL